MNHKLFYSIILFFQLIMIQGIAQNKGNKIESIKIAFLSERLNLAPSTAEKFWPVYNQYDDEMRRVLQESKRDNDTRTAEQILDQEQKAIDIKRKYSSMFLKVISNEQLTQLFQAEREFNKMLMRRMNKMENREGQQNNNGEFKERRMMNGGGRRQEARGNDMQPMQQSNSFPSENKPRFRTN